MAAKNRYSHRTKQEYIIATHEILKDEGIENLSIRKIAKRVGCDSAVLYRNFESLDYLIILGSISFLEDYVQKLLDIENREMKSIDRAIDSWYVLSHTAFENPPLYYHLLYDCDLNLFEEAIVEYYQLFPVQLIDKKEMYYGFFFKSLFAGNSYERNFYYFNRAANDNEIARDDVDFLCIACSSIAANMLRLHKEDYSKPGVSEAAARKCDYMLNRIIESCRIDEHEPRPASFVSYCANTATWESKCSDIR